MDNFTTISILPIKKAQSLKSLLINSGINAIIENQYLNQNFFSFDVRVRIERNKVDKLLKLMKENNDFQTLYNINPDRLILKQVILVPIDFSEYSYKACTFAFNIAKDLNASVRLLHIYFTPFLSTTFPDTETYNSEIEEEQMQQEITDIVKVQMSKFEANIKNKILKGELADVKFSSEITDGIPEEEIRNWTKVNKPLMIVMGTRGKSEKEIDLIGSVTAEVIDTSQIPVFAIPENTTVKSFSDIKKIGYVTNFDQRDLLGFYHLINMQGLNDKKIAFICLIKDSNETLKLDRIKDYFLKNFPDNEFEFGVIKEDELLQDTDKYIKEEQIDLLVITTHKRNIFARLFNPSIAHKMIFHSDTPLLVIRN